MADSLHAPPRAADRGEGASARDPDAGSTARLADAFVADDEIADDARRVAAAVERAAAGPVRSLLDVGCGTGRHLCYFAERFAAEGLDLDPAVLAVARERNPGRPLHRADMGGFDLGRAFDAVVCLGGTIGYVGTIAALRRTVGNLARHVRPGGVVVVAPWLAPADWRAGEPSLEYVERPGGTVARLSLPGWRDGRATLAEHYLAATADGVAHAAAWHELGLFTLDEYAAAFAAAGLAVDVEPAALAEWDLVVGVRRRGMG